GVLLHAACTGRRLTALLVVAFGAGLLFHAALGLIGGQRVIGNYEIFLFSAFVTAVAEAPGTGAPPHPSPPSVAAAVFALAAVGYTGNFWLRPGLKARMRTELAVPRTAMKLSDSPALGRSLYVTGDLRLFYTTLDGFPFGTVRRYAVMVAPKGYGNI